MAREKAQVIWELRYEFKVTLLIDIAEIPRSTYYYHAGQFDKPDKYAEIKKENAAFTMKARDVTATAE